MNGFARRTAIPTFTFDNGNNITGFAATEQVLEGRERFATEKEFAKLSAGWPISRFVEVRNAFAGVVPFDDLKPVKKFTDRKTAVNRVWKAIQALWSPPSGCSCWTTGRAHDSKVTGR